MKYTESKRMHISLILFWYDLIALYIFLWFKIYIKLQGVGFPSNIIHSIITKYDLGNYKKDLVSMKWKTFSMPEDIRFKYALASIRW